MPSRRTKKPPENSVVAAWGQTRHTRSFSHRKESKSGQPPDRTQHTRTHTHTHAKMFCDDEVSLVERTQLAHRWRFAGARVGGADAARRDRDIKTSDQNRRECLPWSSVANCVNAPSTTTSSAGLRWRCFLFPKLVCLSVYVCVILLASLGGACWLGRPSACN